MSLALIGNWLFFLGSLVFMFDSIAEVIEGISLHSVYHLSGGVLFTIGSIIFIPKTQQK